VNAGLKHCRPNLTLSQHPISSSDGSGNEGDEGDEEEGSDEGDEEESCDEGDEEEGCDEGDEEVNDVKGGSSSGCGDVYSH
jgi:hypothetical protein